MQVLSSLHSFALVNYHYVYLKVMLHDLSGAIQVLRNAFSCKFDTHPPPRNAILTLERIPS